MRRAMASLGELIRTGSLVKAAEDVHQRRLACTVLAEQGVDLVTAEVEVDVVVLDDPGKPFRDAAELEDRPLVVRHPR